LKNICKRQRATKTGKPLAQTFVIQNAAARLIVGASKYDAITLTLRDLHWLPVRQRIDFKMGVLASSASMAWLHRT